MDPIGNTGLTPFVPFPFAFGQADLSQLAQFSSAFHQQFLPSHAFASSAFQVPSTAAPMILSPSSFPTPDFSRNGFIPSRSPSFKGNFSDPFLPLLASFGDQHKERESPKKPEKFWFRDSSDLPSCDSSFGLHQLLELLSVPPSSLPHPSLLQAPKVRVFDSFRF